MADTHFLRVDINQCIVKELFFKYNSLISNSLIHIQVLMNNLTSKVLSIIIMGITRGLRSTNLPAATRAGPLQLTSLAAA